MRLRSQSALFLLSLLLIIQPLRPTTTETAFSSSDKWVIGSAIIVTGLIGMRLGLWVGSLYLDNKELKKENDNLMDVLWDNQQYKEKISHLKSKNRTLKGIKYNLERLNQDHETLLKPYNKILSRHFYYSGIYYNLDSILVHKECANILDKYFNEHLYQSARNSNNQYIIRAVYKPQKNTNASYEKFYEDEE